MALNAAQLELAALSGISANYGLSGGNRMRPCFAQWTKFTMALVAVVAVFGLASANAVAGTGSGNKDQTPVEAASEKQKKDAQGTESSAEAAKNANNTEKAEQEQAAKENRSKGVTWEKRFAEIDVDDSGAADWEELSGVYQAQLRNAEWGQTKAIDEFDRNSDGRLEETEYYFFMSALSQALEPAEVATKGQAQGQEKDQRQDLAQK